MAKSSLATKSDIASLFQELEDASIQAKTEEKKNKIKTESQVVELDNFLTSVQEVVRVTQSEVKPTIKPIQEKTEPHKKIKQVEPPTELVETDNNETKVLSKEDENKLGAFSGLMESFGAILDEPPEVKDEDALKLQVQDIYPPEKPKIDESAKIEALEGLFSKLSGMKPQPKIVEKTEPEPI